MKKKQQKQNRPKHQGTTSRPRIHMLAMNTMGLGSDTRPRVKSTEGLVMGSDGRFIKKEKT